MEELICYICEEPIDGDYEELENGEYVCRKCADESCKKCEECENLFPEYDLIDVEVHGEYKSYCESCHDRLFKGCDICGRSALEDDMVFWGDCKICPDCLEERCPSFDEAENQKETTRAYEAFLKKYVGRKSLVKSNTTEDLECEVGDEAPCRYYLSVTLDEKGVITDISRLTAKMLLSESLSSSDWRPYRIDDRDYTLFAEDMLEELELEEITEKESGENE